MAAKWNLRNYEIFAHRGYYGDNTIAGFEKCVEKGYHIETDIVQTADGTVFMSHDRQTNDTAGNTVYVANMTDAEFKTYWPNAPTAEEFISFMLEYPEMLASVSAYQGLDTFLGQIAAAGVDNRIIFDATVPTNQQVKSYPNVSWCIQYADGMTNEDLDAYRTPYNIVSVQEREDNSDGEFPVSRRWSDVHAGTIADLISKGHTWFCSSVNGSALDALAEALVEYTPPNYSHKDMLIEVADAIRTKTGNDGKIVARNFPSQIRKLITYQETDVASELSWKYLDATVYLQGSFQGYYPGISKVTLDMAEGAAKVPNLTYVGFGESDVVVDILNSQNASLSSDFCRQTTNIKEINFVNGIYPSGTLTRFLQQLDFCTATPSPNYNGDVTIKGLYLDNITGFTALLFGAASSIAVNIVWEGTLNSSVDISSATVLTADSINRLISCLADYSEGEAHTLTLGSTNLAKVTDENKAIAAARNWTLA